MHKHVRTLLAPVAALAVAGTVGVSPAMANGGGQHEGHARSATIQTDKDASAILTKDGVAVDAVAPATAQKNDDGTVDLTFPKADDDRQGQTQTGSQDGSQPGQPKEVAFDGGISYTGASDKAEWDDPSLDTSDGQVSFEVNGSRVDLLQVVPEQQGPSQAGTAQAERADHHGHHGRHHRHHGGYELALTSAGADALNQVTGDDSFKAGDIFAGDAHHS